MTTVCQLNICTHKDHSLAAITLGLFKPGTIAFRMDIFTRRWRTYVTPDGEFQFMCAPGDRHTQARNIRSAFLAFLLDYFINPLRIYNAKLIANCIVGCREPSHNEIQSNPDDAAYLEGQYKKAKKGEPSLYNLWFLMPTSDKNKALVHCNQIAQAVDILKALSQANALGLNVTKDYDNAQLKPIDLNMDELKSGYAAILAHKNAKFPDKPIPVKLPVADTLNVLMSLSKLLSEDVGDQRERLLSMTTRITALMAENEELKRKATDQGEIDGFKKEVKKLKKANATLQAALAAATSVEQSEEEED